MIELLVAAALGTLVTIGLIDVLASTKASYVQQENLARMQESGRFAVQTIARHVRRNRSLGCSSLGIQNIAKLTVHACDLLDGNCSGGSLLTPDRPLAFDASEMTGTAGTDELTLANDLPADVAERVAEDWVRGDIIVTWGTSEEGALVVNDNSGPANTAGAFSPTVDRDTSALDANQYALITDCAQSDIFEVTAKTVSGTGDDAVATLTHATGNSQNTSASFAYGYNWVSSDPRLIPGPTHRARVYPFDYSVFFVCCVDTNADPEEETPGDKCRTSNTGFTTALCQWSSSWSSSGGTGMAQQMALNVADLRATVTSDGSSFSDPNDVTDWTGILGMRVDLLLASDDELRRTSQDLSLMPGDLGSEIDPDRRLYQAISVNIGMRASTPWFLSAWGSSSTGTGDGEGDADGGDE